MDRERSKSVSSTHGLKHTSASGKRYSIRFRAMRPVKSKRCIDGQTRVYAAVDHFFSVTEAGAGRPEHVIAVPITDHASRLYQERTGQDLRNDKHLLMELCLDRILAALDSGLDLAQASALPPNDSPLTVWPHHLDTYLAAHPKTQNPKS